jgi:hypothetical protein
MGRRGPKGWSDEIAYLRGNPGHKKLTYPQPLPTAAEIMAASSETSPLGFLERHARSGGDRARPSRRRKASQGQTS